jgi:hypothetical protein
MYMVSMQEVSFSNVIFQNKNVSGNPYLMNVSNAKYLHTRKPD